MSRISVSRETHERLNIYVDCLLQWNRTVNLISAGDAGDVWSRHIADGVAVGEMLSAHPGLIADLGSGAGIPGLVAAIVSNRPVCLVEADQRKCAFLLEAGRRTGAPVTVKTSRIESAGLSKQAVVTARALAPLDRLLALSIPILSPAGVGLFIKGVSAEAEVEAARRQFQFEAEIVRGSGTIIVIRGLKALP